MSEVLGSINRATTTKYTAHKNWNFVSESFSLNNIKYLRGQYSNLPVVISASSAIGEIQNPDGSYIKNTYINLNHLYYTFYDLYGYVKYPQNSFNRELNKECIIYSIPQSKVGNFIKPGSVTLNVTDQTNTLYTFEDNGNYELIDTSILTLDFAPEPILYLGFNKEFNQKYSPNYINNGVTFTPGISNGTYTFGYAANFNGSASLQIENDNTNWFNTFDNDFAISFWLNITPGVNVNASQSIISKKWDNGLLQSYPFDIEYNGASTELYFKRTNDNNNSSTYILNISSLSGYTHFVYQKTGSMLEVYISNIKVSEESITSFSKVSNNSQIYIGAANLNNLNSFEGLIDEIRIYDKALTTNEISTLSNVGYDAFQTNKVGNVFYEDGIIVYSPLQNELISGSYRVKDTSFSYKSSLDIQQQKYYINIPMEKYNTSTNASLYDGITLRSFATGSDFTPYITSIGLYDSKYNLVAVAKLGSPIAKRNDINLNIEIKFDIS